MSHRRAVAFLLSLGLCACGGSGDGGGNSPTPVNLTNFQVAGDILGQTTATGGTPNNGAGAGSPNQVGLNTLCGHLGNGSLYVTDSSNNRVLGWNALPTGFGAPADFVIGQADFTTSTPGVSATKLSLPLSGWVDDDTLFVADWANGRLLIYGGTPNSDAPALVALGKPDLTTGGITSGQAGLGTCDDVCVVSNRIVVADGRNNRVMVWNGIPASSGANADLVLGQPDFTVTSPGLSASKLASPSDVWTDGTRLAVCDQSNHRVLIWSTFPTSNGQAADIVVGQPDFLTGTSGSGTQKLNGPSGVASDGVKLFVADRSNNRVLVFDPFPTSSNPTATGILGQNSFTNVTENDDDQNGVVDAAPTARTMKAPTGVTAVGNRLYVTDSGNFRVLVFTGS